MLLNPTDAVRAVEKYNRESYRGRANVEIDADGYRRFASGLSSDLTVLTEQLHFIGRDYGGAQARFLPHGIHAEAAVIANKLLPSLARFDRVVSSTPPLSEKDLQDEHLAMLFAPFSASKKWGVWASKVLHFLRPASYPVLDSRAKKALGVVNLGSSSLDYGRFAQRFRQALIGNVDALAAARAVDGNSSPSDVKLLDKILFEVGR